MSTERQIIVAPVPRLTLRIDEACECLGVSRDHFDRRIKPSLKLINSGRKVLVRIAELDRWAAEHED